MDANTVYFTPWKDTVNMRMQTDRLYAQSGLLDCIAPGDRVAIKLHAGELGNPNYVRPFFLKQLVDLVKERGGKPFLTDTCTYYPLQRNNAVDHMETAVANGFGFAPFIVADGLLGENGVSVASPDSMLDQVEVAGAVYSAEAMIVVSHVKGHPLATFGGAIKNLAMGCVTKTTKLAQHRLVDLNIDYALCEGCGECIEACWFGLPRIEDDKAVIDHPECMRCPLCSSACPQEAISLQGIDRLAQGLGVAAQGVVDTFGQNKVGYVNFATDLVTTCDCAPIPGQPIGGHVGVFAGSSPVSIDAASLQAIDAQALNQAHNNDCWIQVNTLRDLGQAGRLDPDVVSV